MTDASHHLHFIADMEPCVQLLDLRKGLLGMFRQVFTDWKSRAGIQESSIARQPEQDLSDSIRLENGAAQQ